MEFSKKDTQAIKGIAIIMMLIHHCFMSVDRYKGYNIRFTPFSEDFTVWIAAFFKICVGIFVFLTGYGITITIKRKFDKYQFSKKDAEKMIINRYIKLMADFGFVFIISQIFCWFMNKGQLQVYKSNNIFNSISYIIADGLGIADLFNTPTLNATW